MLDPLKSSLEKVADRFIVFCDRFGHHFRNKTHSNKKQAKLYLSGLMQCVKKKKNMERMAEFVPCANEQALQHFISNSLWDADTVLDHVGRDADKLLGDDQDSCLIVDESGIPKKGEKSVGVARQWCGQLGKVENCQVGVYAALARGTDTTLIDMRLFLPEKWSGDKDRCKAAGIPNERLEHQDKTVLAIELVKAARSRKIRFGWVGMDGLYGQDTALLRELNNEGEVFMADLHKNQVVYLEDPKPIIPERRSNQGRSPTKKVAQCEGVEVRKLAEDQSLEVWQHVTLREGAKGPLDVHISHRMVWFWNGDEEEAKCWHLVIRREIDSPTTIKYSVCNAQADTPIQRLAFMQAQRYWVERSLQDGKNEVGLGDYQTRGWLGWHHHMALVMVAMLFLLEERLACRDSCPLLSSTDVRTLLALFLPRRQVTVEEVLRQLDVRHRKRQSAKNSSCKRRKDMTDKCAA